MRNTKSLSRPTHTLVMLHTTATLSIRLKTNKLSSATTTSAFATDREGFYSNMLVAFILL
jgi:hypothetical protein